MPPARGRGARRGRGIASSHSDPFTSWDRRSRGLGYTEPLRMEQRLKERLTGAAILVALIVLIVPELFHGHLSERAGRAASSGEGPPMRSYLIDLGGNHSAPLELGGASTPAAAPSPAPSVPNASAGSAAPPSSAASSAAAVPARSRETAPVATASPAPSRAGVSAHHVTVPALPAASISPAKGAAHNSSSTPHAQRDADWSVQLGLYAKRVNAEHMVHVAHAKGFSASLAKPDAKGRYRVRVAGLATRSAALTLAARLRAAGLPAAAVGPR